MTRRRYEAYRDSGVEWLGIVPAHWALKRLRHVVDRADEKVMPAGDDTLPYVGLEHVESWTGRLLPLDEDLVPEAQSNRFRKGDVLFGKLRPYLAKAVTPDFDGLCSGEFLVLRSQGYDPRYLRYGLLTDGFVSLVDSSTYGAKMPRANWEFIGDQAVAAPPLEEQRAIAAFLDRETAKVDALIEKKRLLIERLEEQRTALISRTVTRGLPPEAARAAGLDPSPRLKPSGVEWLGEVPEHWEVKRLRDHASIQTGPFGSQLHADEYVEDEVPVINPSNLAGGRLIPDRLSTITSERASELSRHHFAEGDIAFARRGELARAGLVQAGDLPAICGTGSLRIRPGALHLRPAFLMHLLGLRALRDWLELEAVGSTMANLNEQIVGRIPILVPPDGEQAAILGYLAREIDRNDAVLRHVEHAIERLSEYRTALITAAVTGKIDVRESAREEIAAG